MKQWSPEDVIRLHRTTAQTDLVTACEAVLRCGRTKAYELYQRGELPFRTIRVGSRIVVPTAQLLELLGLDDRDDDVA